MPAGPNLSIGCFQIGSCEIRGYNGQHKKTGGGEWQGNPELKQGMGIEQ